MLLPRLLLFASLIEGLLYCHALLGGNGGITPQFVFFSKFYFRDAGHI